MFRMRLVLVRGENTLVFRVGHGFRVANSLAAAVLLVAGLALGTFWVPVILASLAVVGALYEESVTFNKASNRAEFRMGLVLLHRTRAFGLSDIAEVRVSSFGPAKFVGFEVGLTDGRVFTIENDRGKASTERLEGWGRELSTWLGVPLVH